jgi:hypothetical protein
MSRRPGTGHSLAALAAANRDSTRVSWFGGRDTIKAATAVIASAAGDGFAWILAIAMFAAAGYVLYRLVKLGVHRVRNAVRYLRLSEAEKEHRLAVKERERRIYELEQHLAKVNRPPLLGSTSGPAEWVLLYEDRIETSRGSCRLSPRMQAFADAAGNLAIGGRSTFTRMAAGAAIARACGVAERSGSEKGHKSRYTRVVLGDPGCRMGGCHSLCTG